MQFKLSYLIAGMMAASMLSACGHKPAETSDNIEDNDSIPEVIKSLVKAVRGSDKAQFASLVSYPLQRPYPLKDIASKEEMEAYYDILIDDSIQNLIDNSKAHDWGEYGWRGWSLDDGGYIWAYEDIYSIPYVSRRETQMIDSLTNVETASLPVNMRKGWKPIMTMISKADNTVYRIDMRTEGKEKGGHHYRMSVYNSGDDLVKTPSKLLDGVMEVEGSGNFVSYIFHDRNGEEYTVQPDSPNTGQPTLTFPNDSTIDLTKTYWYEIIKK